MDCMTDKIAFGNEDMRMERFREVIREPAPDACETCLQRLDEYIAAQLAGDAYLEQYPDVALHLDACVECAGAYARLYELTVAEANDALPEPAAVPPPDLSFLVSDITTVVAKVLDAITRTGESLTLELSDGLLALLKPPEPAAVLRSGAGERYGKVLLRLPPADTDTDDIDLPITVTAYRDAEQPDLCLIEVVVTPAGESWPNLDGRSVTLTSGDVVRTSETDSWGVAAFEDVPVDVLSEITIDVSGLP